MEKATVTPYLITISRLSTVTPASALEALRVSGALVEVSEYFDSITHRPATTQVNPNLLSQLSQLTLQKTPYGFYLTVRSRNVTELNKEFNLFFKTIATLKFDIGVWAKFIFSTSVKSTNDALLDQAYKILHARGYANQIGLYLDEQNFKEITWSKHSDNWLLWITRPISSRIEFNSLIAEDIIPEQFFEV